MTTTAHQPASAPVDDTPPVLPLGASRLLAGVRPDRPISHAEHRRLAGPLVHRTHAWLVDASHRAGLLGRGGAAFPVATKLAAIATADRPEVVVNGTESEPASWKDRLLMRRAPHRVLDGALVVAAAHQARSVTIAVHDRGSASALLAAARERGDAAAISVVLTGGGFVSGEAAALISGLEGRPAVPPGRRVLPTVQGLGRRPTFVSNVETFAQLGLLATLGLGEFASVGGPTEAGTSLVTLLGDPPRRGVAEVVNGTPLSALIGPVGARPVLVGGYHGTWLGPADPLGLGPGLDRAALRAAGVHWGAGVLAVLPGDTCALGEVARVAAWLASESAGQCGPCTFGLASVAHDLTALHAGRPVDPADLRRRLGLVDGRGACAHPDGVVRFVASALAVMPDEVDAHLRGGCGRPLRGCLPVPGSAA